MRTGSSVRIAAHRVFLRTGRKGEIHFGALDAPDQLTPTYVSWTARRESWRPLLPMNRYERDRES